jgi:serine/threonine protein kinase
MPALLDRITSAFATRYPIERELGRGGMATVYLAHDPRHGRLVAVKVFRPELATSVGAERFLREIQVAARLTHPHILPLHDSGETVTSRLTGAANLFSSQSAACTPTPTPTSDSRGMRQVCPP